jgi:hypothetical protein
MKKTLPEISDYGFDDVESLIRRGLDLAIEDYGGVAALGTDDVKPKEDQIKCALYHVFRCIGYKVHIEAAIARNGRRCDVRVVAPGDKSIAIEIKTAWVSKGWNNKPKEQGDSWCQDVDKLATMTAFGKSEVVDRFFVLLIASQDGYDARLSDQVKRLQAPKVECLQATKKSIIENWQGINQLEYLLFRVHPAKTAKNDLNVLGE